MSKHQLAIGLTVLVLVACVNTSVQMEPVTGSDEKPVHVTVMQGDTVRVLTKYGDRPIFKVTQVTEDALYGENLAIRFDDMAFIEKRKRGSVKGNVVSAALAVVAGAVIVIGINNVPLGIPSVQ